MVGVLESMLGEQAEAVEIVRQAFPDKSEDGLWECAKILRCKRYEIGRYLTVEETRELLSGPTPDVWGNT